MNTIDIKNELKERYKYLYKNAGFIILPFIDCNMDNGNLILDFKVDNNMCYVLESFLLDDRPYNKSTLYKAIEELKLDIDYRRKVKDGKIKDFYYNSDEDKLNDVNVRYVNYILDLVRNYTDRGLRSREFVSKKLRTLDEYYRINRYSTDKVFSSGYKINNSDRQLNGLDDQDKYYVRVVGTYRGLGTGNSKFIEFVANNNNHRSDNLSILSEDEKFNMFNEIDSNRYNKYNKIYCKK